VFVGARFLGLRGLRQRQFKSGLLFEGGGHHEEDQQHDQNVDKSDNDNRGRLSAFAGVKAHDGQRGVTEAEGSRYWRCRNSSHSVSISIAMVSTFLL
jgi:hypothetical protein